MHGYDEDKAKVIARLRRIEGQVRAITQMVEDDKYCSQNSSLILHRYPDADFGVEFGAEIRGVIAAGRSSQPLRAAGVDSGRRGGR